MRWSVLSFACATAVAVLVAAAGPAAAEPLTGRVVNNRSDEPVPNIGVYVQSMTKPGTFFTQRSDPAGRFVFADVPAGLYTIRALIGGTPWKTFSTFLVPPGVPNGGITGPIGLPLGMSTDVELRLTNPDSGGGGTPAPNFNGRLLVHVRRAVGRTDLAFGDIFTFNTTVGWEDVVGQTVRITRVLPTPAAPFDRVTAFQGFVVEEDIAPPTAPDAPPVVWAFDVALVDGNGVAGPATRLTDDTPGWNGIANLLAAPRLATVSGRVFVEPGTPDDVFDPTDQPLPGRAVRLYDGLDLGPGATPIATTFTDGDGLYRFTNVVDGFWVVETDGSDGPERRALDLVLLTLPADPVVDEALTPATCPHEPCGAGPLHEVVVETVVPVGDPTSYTLSAALFDGCGTTAVRDALTTSWAGTFPAPATGANEVLRVESVTVTDGLARVRMRLTAGGAAFPGGYFGTAPRRLEVTLNGALAGACTPLTCDAVAAGADLPPLDGWRGRAAARLRVVTTWNHDSWRRCATLGPCPTQSTDAAGGTNAVEVETTIFGSSGRGRIRRLDVVASAGRTLIDRATLRFSGDTWVGEVVGGAGKLTVQSARRTGPLSWAVRCRLEAPDRLDGQPGALPARVVTFSARIGLAGGSLAIDLGAPPPPGPLFGRSGGLLGTVFRWVNAVDAGCGDN
ncbi:MAG: hypothetical protein JNM10_08945 [Planctomycetia bacterium]|nr:hypothetical protein [Planctomycetia bacterium]